MRFLQPLCLAAAVLAASARAHPSMQVFDEILRRAEADALAAEAPDVEAPDVEAPDVEGPEEPVNSRMLGDLATIGPVTPVGQSIANILLLKESAESGERGYNPPRLGTAKCKADQCCIWSYVSRAMTRAFGGRTGRCNDMARAFIRLGFHDAGTWSSSRAAAGEDFGGADGSIALSADEINRPENNGLQDAIRQARQWKALFGVGMADLIQFGATHAVVSCPLGPRIRVFVGRQDSSRSAPEGLLPKVTSDADTLINLFEDKTISSHELAALVGAHSTSRQFFFDAKKRGFPQDSTPGVWDVKFYNETLVMDRTRIVRFPSDVALAQDSRMSDEWSRYRLGNGIGQDHWNKDYATAYIRLSLLGVNNINNLTECSKVLPDERPWFDPKPFFLND